MASNPWPQVEEAPLFSVNLEAPTTFLQHQIDVCSFKRTQTCQWKYFSWWICPKVWCSQWLSFAKNKLAHVSNESRKKVPYKHVKLPNKLVKLLSNRYFGEWLDGSGRLLKMCQYLSAMTTMKMMTTRERWNILITLKEERLTSDRNELK